MAVSSFSCSTSTPLCSITNLHGGKSPILSSRSLDHKAVACQCAVGEGGFATGAGLSGSGRDLCFTGLLAKQHSGGKLDQCCRFLIFCVWSGRDAGLAAVQASHSTCTAAHRSGWGAAASHSSGFAFSRVDPGVEIGA